MSSALCLCYDDVETVMAELQVAGIAGYLAGRSSHHAH
jgi:hypothetical protein